MQLLRASTAVTSALEALTVGMLVSGSRAFDEVRAHGKHASCTSPRAAFFKDEQRAHTQREEPTHIIPALAGRVRHLQPRHRARAQWSCPAAECAQVPGCAESSSGEHMCRFR